MDISDILKLYEASTDVHENKNGLEGKKIKLSPEQMNLNFGAIKEKGFNVRKHSPVRTKAETAVYIMYPTMPIKATIHQH